jgi:UTP--glucose-1-phosphate uridylyltransferase
VITDAVIPVAGLGTRLLPATRSQPKEMLPLVDTPVVQYVVEELIAAGVKRILFVTGRRKRAIEDHFDSDPELERAVPHAVAPGGGVEILYTRQPRPCGLGDALRHAEGFAAGNPVIVALGDSIIESPQPPPPAILTRLISAYEQTGAAAALAVGDVPDELVSRYGIVIPGRRAGIVDPFEVADMIEKPRPADVVSRTAVMGRYVLGPAVFAALRNTPPDAGGEVQLVDALRAVVGAGEPVLAVPLGHGEQRHDIGTVESYCAAFLRYALCHPTLGDGLRARAAALLDGRR